MNRTALNLLIDVISFFAFLASTISGLVLWQVFPGGGYGFRGGRGLVSEPLFWGLSHHDWLNLHNLTSLLLVALIVLHIALHWRWIRNRVRKSRKAP
jgi:preprotein translocase subunit SecG